MSTVSCLRVFLPALPAVLHGDADSDEAAGSPRHQTAASGCLGTRRYVHQPANFANLSARRHQVLDTDGNGIRRHACAFQGRAAAAPHRPRTAQRHRLLGPLLPPLLPDRLR